SSKKLAKCLLKLEADNLLLVGHEPDLGQHTAWLIGSKKVRVDFAKAGIAWVECDSAPQKGAGALRWLVTPKWLAGQPASAEGGLVVSRSSALRWRVAATRSLPAPRNRPAYSYRGAAGQAALLRGISGPPLY